MINLEILAVEDNILHQEQLRMHLGQIGFEKIFFARNDKDAIRLFRELKPGLVIMDIEIDGQHNGIELAEILMDIHSVPLIFATAKTDTDSIREAQRVHPYAYLTKPYSMENLKAAIEIARHQFENWKKKDDRSEDNLAEWVESEGGAIFTRQGNKLIRTPYSDIEYIKVEKDRYCRIKLGREDLIVRRKLKHFLELLPEQIFVQIHRSTIVNVQKIKSIDEFEQVVDLSNESLAYGSKFGSVLMDRIRFL